MKVLREVGQFSLNEGDGMSKGLYNITNKILLDYTKDEGASYWFDKRKMESIFYMGTFEFLRVAKQAAGNDIYSDEVKENFWNEVMKEMKDGVLTTGVVSPIGGVLFKGDTLEKVTKWFNQSFNTYKKQVKA